MLICDSCGSDGSEQSATAPICPPLTDRSAASSTFLTMSELRSHYFCSSYCLYLLLFVQRSLFSQSVIRKPACSPVFSSLSFVLQLFFLYKSVFSPPTCPCRSAQIAPSFFSRLPSPRPLPFLHRCGSVQFVSVSSSVTTEQREGLGAEELSSVTASGIKTGCFFCGFLQPLCHPQWGSEVSLVS